MSRPDPAGAGAPGEEVAMRFTHWAWQPVTWLLCIGNVVGVWFAARPAEPWHATVHAVAAVLLGVAAHHLACRRTASG